MQKLYIGDWEKNGRSKIHIFIIEWDLKLIKKFRMLQAIVTSVENLTVLLHAVLIA